MNDGTLTFDETLPEQTQLAVSAGNNQLAQQFYDLPDDNGGGATTQTQLAEQFPQVDTPLRIDPPFSLKAPTRAPPLSRDKQIRDSAFSPAAFAASKASNGMRGASSSSSGFNRGGAVGVCVRAAHKELPPLKGVGGQALASFRSNGSALSRNAVADSTMLAFSSAR
jgi:hypothetical protein